MEEIGSIPSLNYFEDEVEFKDSRERASITIWLSPSSKALYNLLKNEYDVKIQREMQKVITKRLEFLKDTVIKKNAG